jgi:hypothetical protein
VVRLERDPAMVRILASFVGVLVFRLEHWDLRPQFPLFSPAQITINIKSSSPRLLHFQISSFKQTASRG